MTERKELPIGIQTFAKIRAGNLAPAGKALPQIKDKAHADKYRHLQQPIHLLGVEFSKVDRNIVRFEVERG